MRTRSGLCLALALALSGCRGGGAALLERELRLQEDEIYTVQDQLDQCQAMLESARRENEALKRELAGGDKGAGDGRIPPGGLSDPVIEMPGAKKSTKPSTPALRGPARKQRPSQPAEMPSFSEPTIELGVPLGPGDSSTEVEEKPMSLGGRIGPLLRGPKKAVTDTHVTSITLNKQLTGGRSHNSHVGDEGVMVVFDARNAAAQSVKAPGEVSIVVVDPSQQGAAARIARWDFAADETLPLYRSTALSEGFHFELPWPSNPPKGKSLQLFVRYTTAEGRKLTAEQTIKVDPPRRQPDRWSPPTTASRQPQSKPQQKSKARPLAKSAAPAAPASRSAPPWNPVASRSATENKLETGPSETASATPEANSKPAAVAERPVWKPYR